MCPKYLIFCVLESRLYHSFFTNNAFIYSTGLRSWLKSATGGKTSVPQIFFNKRYVGGNHELQQVMSAKDKQEWNVLLQEV